MLTVDTATIFNDTQFQAFGDDGAPLALGTVLFTLSSNGAEVDTFTTGQRTAMNTRPVILSASGKADIYVDNGLYDVIVRDSNNLIVRTIEDFSPALSSTEDINSVLDEKLGITGATAIVNIDVMEDILSIDITLSTTNVRGYHTPNDGGGGLFNYDSTIDKSTANGGTIIDPDQTLANQGSGSGLGCWVRQYNKIVNIKDYGVLGDGTDETNLITSIFNNLSSHTTVDFNGLTITVFNSIVGTESGDSILLSEVPRLYNLSGVTIKNGGIVAYGQEVSATKLRYPTTFSVDRCSNIVIDNMKLESKGESYGDTDASVALGSIERAEFAQQNGGHAFLVVRSENVSIKDSEFRLCGSVGSFYSMSSSNTNLYSCFSNAGSLGYGAYAFDSWAGDASETGFPAHLSSLVDCSASREGYTYGSKACVITEDADVTVIVKGGYYADAYPNSASKDIGFAFGSSSSQTIVNGATVHNCAALGYTGVTTTDRTLLMIDNVVATGLRKTVHQNEDDSFGTMEFKYSNVEADVVGGGKWVGDGDLSRKETSYIAMPNDGNKSFGQFISCKFTGATYGFISTTEGYGRLKFSHCDIETNGFLWDSKNIGSGVAGTKSMRGIYFYYCNIRDISAETTAYTVLASSVIYTNIDLSTSTIVLNSVRDIESSTITTPATFIETYKFPRNEAIIETISVKKYLAVNSAKMQSITPSGADRTIILPREDKYKFIDFKVNNADATNSLLVKDYTETTTYATLAPSETAKCWNDGVNNFVYKY